MWLGQRTAGQRWGGQEPRHIRRPFLRIHPQLFVVQGAIKLHDDRRGERHFKLQHVVFGEYAAFGVLAQRNQDGAQAVAVRGDAAILPRGDIRENPSGNEREGPFLHIV